MRRGSLANSIGGRLSATTETTTTTTTITTTMTSITTTKTRLRVSRHMDLDKGAESERATSWTSDILRQGAGADPATATPPPPNALRRTWKQMPANRESAFVEAVTSAAITHTLTKNCSTGEFSDCGCDARMTKRRELSPRNDPVRQLRLH